MQASQKLCSTKQNFNILLMIKKCKRKGRGIVRTQITEGNRNKKETECLQNWRVIKKLAKSIHFMTWKHWAARKNYEELACFVAEDLEESDLKYTLRNNEKEIAPNLSVTMFDKLVFAINKHMETGMAMELSLVNKFTLGADESSSTFYTSKLPSLKN